MKSERYWGERAAQRMYDYHKQADKIADDIAESYIKATNYINGEIKKIFRSYQLSGGISGKEAKELLNNLPDRITLESLKKLVKRVKNPETRQALLNQINSPAYAYRIKRLEQLQQDIDTQTARLASFEQTASRTHYIDLANEAYHHVIFDIQQGTGIGFSFSRMPTSRINEILNQNWSGRLFSERIWGKVDNLNQSIKRELLTQFMTGRSYHETAKVIEERMAVGAMEARRLVRTESTYIANSAEIESYKELGIKKFKFLATLDIRTSDLCRQMDGKEFDVEDAAFGVNVPPLHPWCRSTTIAVIDGAVTEHLMRSARDPKTGKSYEVPANMTYEDWRKDVDKRHGAGTWATERKKLMNEPVDKEQYKRYKAALGKKNVPKTFDLFQEMKYNNTKEWSMLKGYYRSINCGELTILADFELYKSVNNEIDNVLIGQLTQNGIKITNKSAHFIARTIGSVEQRRNGVSVNESLQTIVRPLKTDPVRKNNNGDSQRFIGETAIVTVNPNTGMLIQVNPRHKRKKEAKR